MILTDIVSVTIAFQVHGNMTRYVRFRKMSLHTRVGADQADDLKADEAAFATAMWNYWVDRHQAGHVSAKPIFVKGYKKTLRADWEDQAQNRANCQLANYNLKGCTAYRRPEAADQKVSRWSIFRTYGLPCSEQIVDSEGDLLGISWNLQAGDLAEGTLDIVQATDVNFNLKYRQ